MPGKSNFMTLFNFPTSFQTNVGRDSSVSIANGYGLDGLGSNSGGGEISRTCPDRPWGPTSLLYNGYRVFPGGKDRPGVTLTPHLLLVPWSWMGRAIPLLPLWAVQPAQSLSACTRVHFTLPYLFQTKDGIYNRSPTLASPFPLHLKYLLFCLIGYHITCI